MLTPEPHRLTFQLPPTLALRAEPGRHNPCLHGCVLHVTPLAQVEIEGPSRSAVFDQAIRFLRVVAKEVIRGREPRVTIVAFLRTPASAVGRAARDSYSIVIGADVAISAGPIVPHLAPDNILSAG